MKKCCLCKKEKEIIEFGYDKYESDGRNIRCKSCINELKRNKNYKRKIDGSKSCMHCKEEKKYIEFGNNKSCSDGLHVWCKICARKKGIEYRKKNPENWERQRQRNFIKWREELGVDPNEKLRNRAGEGYINRYGYLTFRRKDHPCADKNGRCQASHLVMYEYIKRPLIKGESVHHKNGHRLDNRIENLELWSVSQPAGQRVEDKIKWCIEFLEQYGYTIIKKVIPWQHYEA